MGRAYDENGRSGLYATTLEVDAVKRIMRENWGSDLKDSGSLEILNSHIDFMERELKLADYEAACMRNVAAHTKHMSKGELRAYTKFIEALAIGYKSKFGMDLTNLLIAGVALLSGDLKSVRKRYDDLLEDINSTLRSYQSRIDDENTRVEGLNMKLRCKESGLFLLRFLKKKEIQLLRGRIRRRMQRISRLEDGKMKHESIANTLKGITNSYSTKKE